MKPGELTESCAVDLRFGLAQGDILSFDSECHAADGAALGVIINADCDLENSKTDGIVSYLPTYPLRAYLARFWAPKQTASILAEALRTLSEICGLKDIEVFDLQEWIRSEGGSTVSSRLLSQFTLKKVNQERLLKQVTRASICLSQRDSLEKIVELSRTENDAQAHLLKQLTAGKAAIGDAGFFINEIYGERGLGFVIRLSRVMSISEYSCFKTQSERLSTAGDHHSGHRIARLTPTYKYRVAQLFANQFSRIGLPDELMSLDAIALDELSDKLLRGVEQ